MTADTAAAGPTPDRPPLSPDLVRRLVAGQFPHWADLPVRPVDAPGWDNRTYRLGTEMLVRLPSAPRYAPAVAKEQRWLPRLAPQLPLPIPTVLAGGEPAEGYPHPWSVYGWIDGEPARPDRITDLTEFAAALARFLTALRQVDATAGPAPGPHCFHRGGPLEYYDGQTEAAIETLAGLIPTDTAVEIWRLALRTTWDRPPVWFHGDMAHGNLLVRDGALAAVIDFGTCGVGDPACDLAIAWTLLRGASRDVFRTGVGLDPDTWDRGRGWALWKALLEYAGAYRHLMARGAHTNHTNQANQANQPDAAGADDEDGADDEAQIAYWRQVLDQIFGEYARSRH